MGEANNRLQQVLLVSLCVLLIGALLLWRALAQPDGEPVQGSVAAFWVALGLLAIGGGALAFSLAGYGSRLGYPAALEELQARDAAAADPDGPGLNR